MGKIQKAITALLTNAVILGGAFGFDIAISEEVIATVATLVTTGLVYVVPNK